MDSIFIDAVKQLEDYEKIPSLSLDNKLNSTEDEIFNVFLNLFNALKILNDVDEDSDSKFTFLEAYPDEEYNQQNLVTFEIKNKKPFKNKSVTHFKPEERTEVYNRISGNMDVVFQMTYDMVVCFQCFSNKSRSLKNLVNLVETTLLKNVAHVKQFVDEILYLGYSRIHFIPTNDKKRLLTRELTFYVKTSHTFTASREELKAIDVSI